MSNERGLTICRPIIYGNTTVPLTPRERGANSEHTHRWTVAVRSPATAPEGKSHQVGGLDDISYFIKKVSFKLHDTYPNPNRTVEQPPFEITETGWGEFDINIRITFVPEAQEKPVQVYHHLKLHPWSPLPGAVDPDGNSPAPSVGMVHSWQYDEIVFHDPTKAFLKLLIGNPPTPLPKGKRKCAPFHIADLSSDKDLRGVMPEFTTQFEKEELERLEEARKTIVAETQRLRDSIIEREKELARLRQAVKQS